MRPRMPSVASRVVTGVVALVVIGCGTPTRPPATAGDPLDLRFRALGIARAEIAMAVLAEDTPRDGVPKPESVREQVAQPMAAAVAARDRARAALDAKAPDRAQLVERFAQAMVTLEQHYLRTLLYATDAPRQPGPFVADDGRDVLAAPGVVAKLQRWQAASGFVKFAVPPPAPGGRLELRVGPRATYHVDLAAGPALAAGLLRFRFEQGRAVVIELENTSGGFRPGPLRNRTALAALAAADALPEEDAELIVHHNPSGDYDRSQMAHP